MDDSFSTPRNMNAPEAENQKLSEFDYMDADDANVDRESRSRSRRRSHRKSSRSRSKRDRSPSGSRSRSRSRRHRRRKHRSSRHGSRSRHRRSLSASSGSRSRSRSISRRESPPVRSGYGSWGRRDSSWGRGRGGGYRGGGRGGGHRGGHRGGRGGGQYNGWQQQDESEEPRTAEEEASAIERDARTVFVAQLLARTKDEWVAKYFESAGPVSKVRLIMDKTGRRCKGQGYVEFESIDSVPNALLLSGQKMCMKHEACTCSGFPIVVQSSGAEKNYAHQADSEGQQLSARKTLFVGNLPDGAGEDDVAAVYRPTGAIERVRIERDRSTNQPYGLVTFAEAHSAQAALVASRSLSLGGQALRVGIVANQQVHGLNGEVWTLGDQSSMKLSAQARANLVASLTGAAKEAASRLVQSAGPAAFGVHAPDTSARPQQHQQQSIPGMGPVGSAPGRYLATEMYSTAPLDRPEGDPSRCLRLVNLFDPADVPAETDEDWDEWAKDVQDEVAEQCDRHGTVILVRVKVENRPRDEEEEEKKEEESARKEAGMDDDTEETQGNGNNGQGEKDDLVPTGCVYVCMATPTEGVEVGGAMAGRYYAGHKMVVEFVPESDFFSLFPRAEKRLQRRHARYPEEAERAEKEMEEWKERVARMREEERTKGESGQEGANGY